MLTKWVFQQGQKGIIKKFEELYPGIKVDYFNHDSKFLEKYYSYFHTILGTSNGYFLDFRDIVEDVFYDSFIRIKDRDIFSWQDIIMKYNLTESIDNQYIGLSWYYQLSQSELQKWLNTMENNPYYKIKRLLNTNELTLDGIMHTLGMYSLLDLPKNFNPTQPLHHQTEDFYYTLIQLYEKRFPTKKGL